MDKERFYTVHEVAELLDITEEQVRRNIRNRKLNAFISSRRKGYRIPSSYLDEYLAKVEQGKDEKLDVPKTAVKPLRQSEGMPLIIGYITDQRDNGFRTALLVDHVNRAFVYDRRWSMNEHRNDNIEVFPGYSLEMINRMADIFEEAGLKEFGRGFFDQD